MGDEDDYLKSGGPEPPDGGLFHYELSLMWGEHKGQVGELTMEKLRSQMVFEERKESLNAQIRMLTVATARFQQLLAEARAYLAADHAEMKEKYQQKAKFSRQYYRYVMARQKRFQWIMYQGKCAIKVVRNAVLVNCTTCQTDTIMDCDLDAWVKGSCTVSLMTAAIQTSHSSVVDGPR